MLRMEVSWIIARDRKQGTSAEVLRCQEFQAILLPGRKLLPLSRSTGKQTRVYILGSRNVQRWKFFFA